jgi:hypothetical protein
MITKNLIVTALMLGSVITGFGQNFTSTTNGSWTTGSNWGGTAPATSGQSWGTINVNHNMSITGNYSTSAGTLNVAASKTLSITGNFSISNGITVNVYGNLNISGSATLDANLRIHPGGTVTVGSNVTVISSQYLTVGTSVAPPAYANLVIMGNLSSQTSGDITINQNGRFALFGNLTNDGGGGTFLTVNNGGQTYIHGNIAMTGGADINNNNTTDPYGLYVNGTISNTGGGATTDSNLANKATMKSTNLAFYNWASSVSGGLLPVKLLFFTNETSNSTVLLKWATATEQNFDRFIIERSINGIDFSEIGSLKGAGNSIERNDYTFEDRSPVIGKVYYRLKAVDFDGKFEHFNVLAVEYTNAKQIQTYPNPSNGNTIRINLNFEPSINTAVQIFDTTGLLIGEYPVSAFENEINFAHQLHQGTYLMRFSSEDHSEVVRFSVK